jgi:pilus assembly protein Flp/PilA
MLSLYCKITSWLHSEEGQGMAEYALIIALIAILLVAALLAVRTNLSTTFSRIGSGLSATS